MNWEEVKAFVDRFTNNPLVISILTALVSFACALVIFSKTSLGKKAINELTKLYQIGHQNSSKTLKKVEEVETYTKDQIKALESDYEQKFNNYKNECETRVATVVSIFNYNEEKLFAIIEKIPNAKVQEELKNFKLGYEEKKQEISEVVGVIYQDYEVALEQAKEDVRKEYDEKINFLENQIKQFNLYLSEIRKEEEQGNGEREEAKDTDSIKEEIQEN